MKIKAFFIGLLALLAVTVAPRAAESYTINWYKIAGGAGTSANGQYSVSGTIGQHDAGTAITGGNYSLTGGFWGLVTAVQVPRAPLLTITHSGNGVVISWPTPSTGFILQQNNNLADATGWSNFGGTVNDNGFTRSITNSPPVVGSLFFRLAHP
jgi:hypothetical protein